MNYCGNCGAPAGGNRFCTNCGKPLTAPDPTGGPSAGSPDTQTPPSMPPEGPQPGGASPHPVLPPPPRPAPPRVPPAAVLRHAAVDVLAAVALFVSLALPWDSGHRGVDHWYVVLAVLVSFFSMAVPWLLQAGVIPPEMARPATLGKRILAAPLLMSVAATVVLDLVHVREVRDLRISSPAIPALPLNAHVPALADLSGWAGVGSAVALALVGALLAAAPRRAEPSGRRVVALAGLVGRVLVLAGLVLILLTTVVNQFGPGAAGAQGPTWPDLDVGGLWLRLSAFVLVAMAVVVWLPGVGRGRVAGAVPLLAAGATYLVLAMVFGGEPDVGPSSRLPVYFEPVESIALGNYGGYLVLGGVTLVCVVAVLGRRRQQVPGPAPAPVPDGVSDWRRAARTCLTIVAVTMLLQALLVGFGATYVHRLAAVGVVPPVPVGRMVAVLVLCLVSAGVAALAAGMAGLPTTRAVWTVVGAACLLACLGIAVLLLVDAPAGVASANWTAVAGWFALPWAAVAALVLPGSVRAEVGPLLPSVTAPGQSAEAPGTGPD